MKRLLITTVVVYLIGFLFSFLVHGLWMAEDYKSIASMMRPEAEAKMGIMMAGYLVWSLGFAWLYSKGVEAKPWMGQGLRFGLLIAAVWAVPAYAGMYAFQPFPGELMVKGLVGDAVNGFACALAAAFIYKGEAAGS